MNDGRSLIARSVLKGILLVTATACVNACAVAPLPRSNTVTPTQDADRAAILSHGERWIIYYQAGEIEKIRALYEDDALVMPNGSALLRGSDETVDFFGRNRRSGNEVTFRSEPENLVIEGDRAYLVTKYAMRIISQDGKLTHLNGRTFLVYRRGIDGAWRIWRDMDNSAPDVALEVGN